MSDISKTKYNLRKDPFTKDWDDNLPSPGDTEALEEHTIPAATPFHITLEEVPKYDDISTLFIYLTDTLNGAVLIGDGTITVTNGDFWAVDDILKIDDEYCLVTGVAVNDLAVTRGYGDSIAAAHDTATQFRNMGANELVEVGPPAIYGVDKFTEKTTTPVQGQFEVHYGTTAIPYKRGLIQFHEDDAEKIVLAEYIKTGHYNWAEHINDLQTQTIEALCNRVSIEAPAEVTALQHNSSTYTTKATYRVYIPSGAKLRWTARIKLGTVSPAVYAYVRILVGGSAYAEVSKTGGSYTWIDSSEVSITQTGFQTLEIQLRCSTGQAQYIYLQGFSIYIR